MNDLKSSRLDYYLIFYEKLSKDIRIFWNLLMWMEIYNQLILSLNNEYLSYIFFDIFSSFIIISIRIGNYLNKNLKKMSPVGIEPTERDCARLALVVLFSFNQRTQTNIFFV